VTLAEAIEGLYAAFAPYPRRDGVEACPCCVGRAEQDTLARVSLRALSCEELGQYAFKAMTTWGAPEDYKHFLPRILELAASTEGRGWPGLDLLLIAGKLQLAGRQSWPEAEREALHGFLHALWRIALAHDPDECPWRASELLPGIAAIVDDLAPFLDAWERDGSVSSLLQLADLIDSSWADIARRGHLRGRWRDLAGRERMERWLTDPERRRSLEEAFERHVDDPLAGRLAAAVDAWGWMSSGVD
jgi:hypothetical protein